MDELNWLIDWVARLADTAQSEYGVRPAVFIGIFVASIPVFYVALAIAVKETVRLKRQGMPYRSGRLSISIAVLALSWLSPYLYVMIWGRNLPWFVWVVLGLLVALGGIRLLRSLGSGSRTSER